MKKFLQFMSGIVCFMFFIIVLSEKGAEASTGQVPLYGLFEQSITNNRVYSNPFFDVELNAVFTSPSGRVINFFGFYDGDGHGGQDGTVWKQRFMPDELGTWTYSMSFSDGSRSEKGIFECVSTGAKPGPWKQHQDNYRWLTDSQQRPVLPVMVYMWMYLTPADWKDGIAWAQRKGYNTIVTPTFNDVFWGDGWENPTAFIKETGSPGGSASGSKRKVNYDYFLIKRWKEWDDMIQAAGDAGIYISPTNTPNGYWGGQSGLGTLYPPTELAYFPQRYHAFNTPHNLKVIKYFVARQAAFWNIANWSLYPGEVYEIKDRSEVVAFGEYLASITPFGRMITAQDIEEQRPPDPDRRWLSEMNFSSARKLNTVQVGDVGPNGAPYQEAGPNNQFALGVINRGFPVIGTESLWEGQHRANKPLRMIWGSFTAGMNTVWADFKPEHIQQNTYMSLGHSWIPLKPLSQAQFQSHQLGSNTVGDEYLAIAGRELSKTEYWKMRSHNELVQGSSEAYCLAEKNKQYVIYSPNGGTIRLDLTSAHGTYEVKWLNPKTGNYQEEQAVTGNRIVSFNTPTTSDWVLLVMKNSDTTPPGPPRDLRIKLHFPGPNGPGPS